MKYYLAPMEGITGYYNEAVSKLLKEQEIVAGVGLFSKHD